jgi:hypothetical protein
MGVGGALIMPTTLSILVNVFRRSRERPRRSPVDRRQRCGIAVARSWAALMRHFSWSSVF